MESTPRYGSGTCIAGPGEGKERRASPMACGQARVAKGVCRRHLPAMPQLAVHIAYPGWVDDLVNWDRTYTGDIEKMRVAIAMSLENVERETGGPFGAAVFERDTGRLVAVGMNSVVRLNNCTLHGEMVAFMMAQQRLGSFSLAAPGLPEHELFTSCEPCAMCLGATLWSGVKRVVYGANRDDAARLNFDEGPVFPGSYKYLEDRGITFVRHVLRTEAQAVLERYRVKSGKIYNA
ncbi:MAG: nucleoside deaminase [bacterium]